MNLIQEKTGIRGTFVILGLVLLIAIPFFSGSLKTFRDDYYTNLNVTFIFLQQVTLVGWALFFNNRVNLIISFTCCISTGLYIFTLL